MVVGEIQAGHGGGFVEFWRPAIDLGQGQELLDLVLEGGKIFGREGEDFHGAVPGGVGFCGLEFFEDSVSVTASEPEGADSGAAGIGVGGKPWAGPGGKKEPGFGLGEGGMGCADASSRKKDLGFERVDGFDQSCHA